MSLPAIMTVFHAASLRKSLSIFVCLTNVALAGPLPAKSSPTQNRICNDELLRQSQTVAANPLSDAQRLSEINQHIDEIQELLTHGIPDAVPSLLRSCLEKQRSILSAHSTNSSESLRSKAAYHKLWGRYFEMEGNRNAARASYQKVAELDPTDFEAAFKAYANYLPSAIQRIQSSLTKSSLAKIEEEVLRETDRLLSGIMSHSKAPSFLKAQAHLARAKLLQAMHRELESKSDWQKTLEFDPKNFEALTHLALIARTAGETREARRYLEKLEDHPLSTEAVYGDLIEYQIEQKDTGAALRTSQKAQKKHPSSTRLQELEVKALLASERLSEAEVKLRAITSKSSAEKGRPLDGKSSLRSLLFTELYEKQAALALSQGKVPLALESWDRSLKLNPRNDSLRERIARSLYERYKQVLFTPLEAVQTDFGYALGVLEGGSPRLLEDLSRVQLHLSLAVRSALPQRGAKSCDQYAKLSKGHLDGNAVIDCMRIWNAAGEGAKARKWGQEALRDPSLSAMKSDIQARLSQLAPALNK